MSEENVEALRRAVIAYNGADVDALLEELDPDVEWRSLNQVMFGGQAQVYTGHDGVRRFMTEVEEAFAQARIEKLEVRDLGERVVGSGQLHIRGRASGVEIDSPIAWLAEFKDGRMTRIKDYLDPRQALEDAGLSR